MEKYETLTKQGKIEKRIYVDSGKFVLYGYESEGKLTNKYRLMLSGKNKKSMFLISTGKSKGITVDADFEDEIYILTEGKAVRVSELLY
ncbi:MAG: hypothetical protein QXO03_01915 [Thermoplasmatales archaeon]